VSEQRPQPGRPVWLFCWPCRLPQRSTARAVWPIGTKLRWTRQNDSRLRLKANQNHESASQGTWTWRTRNSPIRSTETAYLSEPRPAACDAILADAFGSAALHDRKVERLLALEDAPDIDARLAIGIALAGPGAHQAAGREKLALTIGRRPSLPGVHPPLRQFCCRMISN
jgi:hypothetical protein